MPGGDALIAFCAGTLLAAMGACTAAGPGAEGFAPVEVDRFAVDGRVGPEEPSVKPLARRVGGEVYVQLHVATWLPEEADSDLLRRWEALVTVRLPEPTGDEPLVVALTEGNVLRARVAQTSPERIYFQTLESLEGSTRLTAVGPAGARGLHLELRLVVERKVNSAAQESTTFSVELHRDLLDYELPHRAMYDGQCEGYDSAIVLPSLLWINELPSTAMPTEFEWGLVERDCDGGTGCWAPEVGWDGITCQDSNRWMCSQCYDDTCLWAGFEHCDEF